MIPGVYLELLAVSPVALVLLWSLPHLVGGGDDEDGDQS